MVKAGSFVLFECEIVFELFCAGEKYVSEAGLKLVTGAVCLSSVVNLMYGVCMYVW